MAQSINRRDILKGSIAMTAGIMATGSASSTTDENPFPPKIIVRARPETYSPLAYLEKLDNETLPQLSFKAKARNLKKARDWQNDLRSKLLDLIGEEHHPGETNPTARLLETKKLDDCIQEKWELDVTDGRAMPVYILWPKNRSLPPRPR